VAQATENVADICLDELLFIRTSEGREQKHVVFVAPESLRDPQLSHVKQV
jgi:hypothetical protein